MKETILHRGDSADAAKSASPPLPTAALDE